MLLNCLFMNKSANRMKQKAKKKIVFGLDQLIICSLHFAIEQNMYKNSIVRSNFVYAIP